MGNIDGMVKRGVVQAQGTVRPVRRCVQGDWVTELCRRCLRNNEEQYHVTNVYWSCVIIFIL